VRETSDPEASRVDWSGCITFSLALFALLAGLIKGNDWGWQSPRIVALLAAAIALLVAFLALEIRQHRPMLDLSLFRKPAFAGVSLSAVTVSGSLFAMFVYLTLFFQSIQGATPLQTGLRFLPTTVLSFLVAAVAGRLTGRVSLRTLLTGGLLLTALGLWDMTQLSVKSSWTALLPGLVLSGIGFGIVNPTLAATTLSIVPPARSGMASGMNSTCRQLGIAIGIAALGAVFEHQIVQRARAALTSVPHAAAITHAFASGKAQHAITSAPPSLQPRLEQAAHSAAVGALDRVFAISALIALAGAILSATLVRTRDFVTHAPAMPAPSA